MEVEGVTDQNSAGSRLCGSQAFPEIAFARRVKRCIDIRMAQVPALHVGPADAFLSSVLRRPPHELAVVQGAWVDLADAFIWHAPRMSAKPFV